MIDYSLYLVTDDPSHYVGNWLDNVVAAVEGGVTCVQYRDTESDEWSQYARVKQLQDALQRFGTPVIVNNDAEMAAAVGAAGIHVGQRDLSPAEVREIVGPNCEIGLSITSPAQLAKIPDDLVACLGIGPVFDATATKADAAAPLGTAGLAAICRALADRAPALKRVAIGGINLENAAEVLAAGVDGLAVVSAFSRTDNPFVVAHKFRAL